VELNAAPLMYNSWSKVWIYKFSKSWHFIVRVIARFFCIQSTSDTGRFISCDIDHITDNRWVFNWKTFCFSQKFCLWRKGNY
jgi:hypothetical protein